MKRRAVVEDGPSLSARSLVATDTADSEPLLTARQRHELMSLSSKITVPAGRVIYHQHAIAAALYFCQSGLVKTYRVSRRGHQRVMSFLFANDIFGLAERGRYVNTAQAVCASTCYRIPMPELTAVLRQDASLQYQFLCKVTHELREFQHRAILLGRHDPEGRLAMFLEMLRKHRPASARRDVIPIPMSRSDVAGYLGQPPETVAKAGAQLKRRGIVAFEGRHAVRVLDEQKLEELAADY